MNRTVRRWLLPDTHRAGVVLIVSACAGSAVLAWVGHYGNTEMLIALAATAAAATGLAYLPGRAVPPAARAVGAVLAASPPPVNRMHGRCTMILRLNDSDGTPRQFVHVDAHTPTATWPLEGSRVVVEVTKARTPRVTVLWHLGVNYPEPVEDERGIPVVPGMEEADLAALPRLERVDLVPVWQPSAGARRYLFPTEKFRGEWRRHWIRWFKELSVGLAIALLLLTDHRFEMGEVVIDFDRIEDPELVSQLAWFAWVLWRGLTWLNTRLVLTNKRLILVKGVFWRRVASLPLAKAADIVHSKSPLGVLVGYGTVRFTNVPVLRPVWKVGDLPRPTELYLRIVEETFEPEAAEARRRIVPMDDGSTTLDELLAVS